jgi:hypothetical protein
MRFLITLNENAVEELKKQKEQYFKEVRERVIKASCPSY